jgi:hypothetical protein
VSLAPFHVIGEDTMNSTPEETAEPVKKKKKKAKQKVD